MPKIPEYVPRVGIPAVELPSVPLDAGSAVPKALEKVGAGVFAEGVKWADQIRRAQQSAALSVSSSNLSVQLSDLANAIQNSPQFATDPDAARAQWEGDAKSIAAKAMEGVNDGTVKQALSEKFDGLYAGHTIHFSDAVRKQKNDIVRGAELESQSRFADQAARAPTDAIFQWNIDQGYESIDRMIMSGAARPSERDLLRRRLMDQSISTRVATEALKDVRVAEATLNRYSLEGKISPETALRLASHLQPEILAQTSRETADKVLHSSLATGSNPIGGKLSASQIEMGQAIMGALMTEGLETHQAAGFVNNIMEESSLIPHGKPGDKGRSWYLAQWNGTRLRDLNLFAKERGETTPSRQTQIDFMIRELKTTHKAAWEALKAAKTEREATDAAMIHYEKPADQTPGSRALYGHQLHPDLAKNAPLPSNGPNAKLIEKNLPELEKQAVAEAEKLRPGDLMYRDLVKSQVHTKASQISAQQQAGVRAANDVMNQAFAVPDGGPKSLDELKADPERRAAYDLLYRVAPEHAVHVNSVLRHNAKNEDVRRSEETDALNYMLLGQSVDNPAVFADRTQTNLLQYRDKLPHADWDRLVALQLSIDKKSILENEKQVDVSHAISGLNAEMRAAKLDPTSKKQDDLENMIVFKGKLVDGIARFREENKRRPGSEDILNIGRRALTVGRIAGSGYTAWAIGEKQKPFYAAQGTEDEANFYVPVKSINKGELPVLNEIWSRHYGTKPSDMELSIWATHIAKYERIPIEARKEIHDEYLKINGRVPGEKVIAMIYARKAIADLKVKNGPVKLDKAPKIPELGGEGQVP